MEKARQQNVKMLSRRIHIVVLETALLSCSAATARAQAFKFFFVFFVPSVFFRGFVGFVVPLAPQSIN